MYAPGDTELFIEWSKCGKIKFFCVNPSADGYSYDPSPWFPEEIESLNLNGQECTEDGNDAKEFKEGDEITIIEKGNLKSHGCSFEITNNENGVTCCYT